MSGETIDISHGVALLWGFADGKMMDQVVSLGDDCGFSVYLVEPRRIPRWAARIRGVPFVFDLLGGEYSGGLGMMRPLSTKRGSDEWNAQCSAFKKKHPNWTDEKIVRSVEQKLKAMARGPCSGHFVKAQQDSVEATLRFLRELVRIGPVTLLLDDGGTMGVSLGGTDGLPESSQQPKRDKHYRMPVSAVTPEFLLAFPYWVPVEFVE